MIYTFVAPTPQDCAMDANMTIPSTEKIEHVTVSQTDNSYTTEYLMLVVTNPWYSYAKYTKGA